VRGRGLHSSTFQLNLSRFGHLIVSPCLIDWGKPMHQSYPTEFAYVEPKSERVQALGVRRCPRGRRRTR